MKAVDRRKEALQFSGNSPRRLEVRVGGSPATSHVVI